MSSRRLLILLDGLPPPSDTSPGSWYKQSLIKWIREMPDRQERQHSNEIRSLIHAQLTGQRVKKTE